MQAADDALRRLHALRSQFFLAEFNKATPAFVEQTELLQDVIDQIRVDSPAMPALRTFNDLLAASSTIYAAVARPERLASATDGADDFTITLPVRDAHDLAPRSDGEHVAAGAAGPSPVNSTSYGDLKDEYVACFQRRAAEAGAGRRSRLLPHEAEQAPRPLRGRGRPPWGSPGISSAAFTPWKAASTSTPTCSTAIR